MVLTLISSQPRLVVPEAPSPDDPTLHLDHLQQAAAARLQRRRRQHMNGARLGIRWVQLVPGKELVHLKHHNASHHRQKREVLRLTLAWTTMMTQ